MLDTLKSNSWEDFRQRYNHTYCWLIRGPERQFVYIQAIDSERVKFTIGNGVVFTANADAGAVFEFIPVDRGWYNTVDGSILHMTRVPERQFRRGISEGNTLLADESLFPVDLTYKRLHSVFSLPKQWDRKFEPGIPNALSKHFAYLPDSGKLMFHNVHIGDFATDGFKVDHNFLQEVSDVFRRRNIEVAIKGR